jgi:hypothetical protein
MGSILHGEEKSEGVGACAPTPSHMPRAASAGVAQAQGSTGVQAMPQLPQSVYCALGTGQSIAVQAMPQLPQSE